MQTRSRNLHLLKKLVLETATLFVCPQLFYRLHNVKAFYYITSVLGLFQIFKIEDVKMGYNCFGGLGLVEKAVYFLKQ